MLLNINIKDGNKMIFSDHRKPNQAHLYYVYVYPKDGEENSTAVLYRLGSIMELKRKLRDQHRKYDIVKVW